MFSPHVSERIGSYVYRLIDPRNGETFYVGKGVGNRVFAHIRDELKSDGDEATDKLRRIREIRRGGFEVAHVIHRHGLTDKEAREVEAALIDAYPETMNEVRGYSSDQRGVRHADEISRFYDAPEAVFRHSAVLITINRTIAEAASIYEAVHYAWKLNPDRARTAELVIAADRGLIVGVFIASQWLAATPENFPGTVNTREGRWGFVGQEAPADVTKQYLHHRIPDDVRKRGASNPVRYVARSDSALPV